jgi:hypothetical protein
MSEDHTIAIIGIVITVIGILVTLFIIIQNQKFNYNCLQDRFNETARRLMNTLSSLNETTAKTADLETRLKASELRNAVQCLTNARLLRTVVVLDRQLTTARREDDFRGLLAISMNAKDNTSSVWKRIWQWLRSLFP